jgi:translation initiation factor 1 (eIF-1/SUI1)
MGACMSTGGGIEVSETEKRMNREAEKELRETKAKMASQVKVSGEKKMQGRKFRFVTIIPRFSSWDLETQGNPLSSKCVYNQIFKFIFSTHSSISKCV